MNYEKHKFFKDVLIFHPQIYSDHRGSYVETFNIDSYNSIFPNKINFVQDDFSFSVKNVLRGLHGDNKTWKLVSCINGEFLLTIVDCDVKSSTYLMHDQLIFKSENYTQILIPPNFANGHLCTSYNCIFHYKQSEYYDPKSQFTVKWNDEKLNIKWQINNPILSQRDLEGPFLDFKTKK